MNTMMKWTIRLAVALVSSLVLAACASGDSNDVAGSDSQHTGSTSQDTGSTVADTATSTVADTATMTFAATAGPRTWAPHAETRAFVLGWYDLIYDGLLTTDAAGALASGLATEWTVTPETLELTLREGVTFHDGTSFDAEVAKTNLLSAQEEAPAVFEDVKEIEVIDPTHLVLHLSTPDPDLPSQLASFAGLMVSPEVSREDLESGVPAGTGPYKIDVEASQPDARWEFEPNSDFWGEGPHFSGVEGRIISDDAARLNALLDGQLDFALVRAGQREQVQSAGFSLASVETAVNIFQVIDLDGELVPELANPKVRRALAHAIDREAFVEASLGGLGEPTTQLFAEGELGHIEGYEAPTYDTEKARRLLADAGVENLQFSVPAFGPFAKDAQVLQSMFADVGVTMNIDTTAPGQLTSAIAGGSYPAAAIRIPDRHPHSVYAKHLRPGAVYNPFEVMLDEVAAGEAASREAVAEGDQVLAEAYERMYRPVYEQAWIVPIAKRLGAIAYDEDALTGAEAWRGVPAFLHLRSLRPAS